MLLPGDVVWACLQDPTGLDAKPEAEAAAWRHLPFLELCEGVCVCERRGGALRPA